jgi:hypothetical protein
MRRLAPLCLLALAACTQAPWQASDPRDRIGDQTKPAAWALVERPEGAAALLARPGGAPDLVVWCKPGTGSASLRAHVFTPEDAAALSIEGGSAPVVLPGLRLQGGLRGSERVLIETDAPLAAFMPLAEARLRYGGQTYAAPGADRDGAFAAWLAACGAPSR